MNNQKRMIKIRALLNCKTDVELAEKIGTNQPQISRWRNVGFRKTTEAVIDSLLSIITQLKKQNRELKKEIEKLKDQLNG